MGEEPVLSQLCDGIEGKGDVTRGEEVGLVGEAGEEEVEEGGEVGGIDAPS